MAPPSKVLKNLVAWKLKTSARRSRRSCGRRVCSRRRARRRTRAADCARRRSSASASTSQARPHTWTPMMPVVRGRDQALDLGRVDRVGPGIDVAEDGRDLLPLQRVRRRDEGERRYDDLAFNPVARIAISSATVPLHIAMQCFTPRNWATFCSNSCTNGPLLDNHRRSSMSLNRLDRVLSRRSPMLRRPLQPLECASRQHPLLHDRRRFDDPGGARRATGPCAVNLIGLRHVERNGHHYVNGMAGLPQPEQDGFLAAHPGLYEQSQGAVRLEIRNGRLGDRIAGRARLCLRCLS